MSHRRFYNFHPNFGEKYVFIYSSYWGVWSRVLAVNHNMSPEFGFGDFVEVNLQPINSWTWPGELERVKSINIRVHGTTRDRKDRNEYECPEHVRTGMLEHLGAELTERLLTEDFYSQIDWDLYRKHCNGGASFDLIRRI